MMFAHYAELPQDILDQLIFLKGEIERLDLGQGEYMDLLHSYYDEIDKAWSLISDPLPPKCELKEGLMPEYYYEFLEEYKQNGPVNFLSQCKRANIIALVNLKSVRCNNEKLFVDVIEIYKGRRESFVADWLGNIKISYNSFMDDRRFKKGQKVIALISDLKDGPFSSDNRLFISSSNLLLPVVIENSIQIVESVVNDKSYWRNLGLPTTRVSEMTRIPLSSLIEWLRINASNFLSE